MCTEMRPSGESLTNYVALLWVKLGPLYCPGSQVRTRERVLWTEETNLVDSGAPQLQLPLISLQRQQSELSDVFESV